MSNEETSLSLAEGWVLENLRKETFEQGLAAGDLIEVTRLDQCDCVPVDVTVEAGWHRIGSPAGRWRLVSVESAGVRRLDATYKWEPKS